MSIKSIAGNLAAYALKRAYDAGKAIEIPSLGIVIKRPEPGFENVIPAGEGWYTFCLGKWRLTGDETGHYLGREQLTDFAIEAMKALAK